MDHATSTADTVRPAQPGQEVPLVGRVLEGKYKVIRKIGEGGMGAVYEGERTVIGRRVAIKTLHAQMSKDARTVARFINEAKAANKILHPNIIEVYDFGQVEDGSLYLVLEFLEGHDLADLVEKEGTLPLKRAVHILEQMCDALSVAHKAGIVHRDIKPDNVFLVEHGGDRDFVKLLDFGISKIKPEHTIDNLTRTGDVFGTPYYMAPEQAKGHRAIDARADIYALGVVLFNMVTGQYPVNGETLPQLLLNLMTEPPTNLSTLRPDLPRAVVRLVERMLAKDPDARPATCEEIKAELKKIPIQDGPTAPRHTVSGYPMRTDHKSGVTMLEAPKRAAESEAPALPTRSRKGLIAAALAGVAALAVGGAFLFSQESGEPAVVATPSTNVHAPDDCSGPMVDVYFEAAGATITVDGQPVTSGGTHAFPRCTQERVVIARADDGSTRQLRSVFNEDAPRVVFPALPEPPTAVATPEEAEPEEVDNSREARRERRRERRRREREEATAMAVSRSVPAPVAMTTVMTPRQAVAPQTVTPMEAAPAPREVVRVVEVQRSPPPRSSITGTQRSNTMSPF